MKNRSLAHTGFRKIKRLTTIKTDRENRFSPTWARALNLYSTRVLTSKMIQKECKRCLKNLNPKTTKWVIPLTKNQSNQSHKLSRKWRRPNRQPNQQPNSKRKMIRLQLVTKVSRTWTIWTRSSTGSTSRENRERTSSFSFATKPPTSTLTDRSLSRSRRTLAISWSRRLMRLRTRMSITHSCSPWRPRPRIVCTASVAWASRSSSSAMTPSRKSRMRVTLALRPGKTFISATLRDKRRKSPTWSVSGKRRSSSLTTQCVWNGTFSSSVSLFTTALSCPSRLASSGVETLTRTMFQTKSTTWLICSLALISSWTSSLPISILRRERRFLRRKR